LAATLAELAGHYAARRVCVAREITKLHEEVLRGTLAEVAALLGARVVVVLEGAHAEAPVDDAVIRAALEEQLADGASTRDAVSFVAESLGVARRVVYQLALERRADEGR
jgi:16S rRNA (cytidine1402-2'-O)-methyltransferase